MYNSDDDLPEAPDLEEIAQTQIKLEELRERIEQYIEVASAVNDKVDDQISHRPALLDEIPYAEEVRRLEESLDALENAAGILEEIEETTPAREAETKHQEALDAIEEAQYTLKECTPLPSSS